MARVWMISLVGLLAVACSNGGGPVVAVTTEPAPGETFVEPGPSIRPGEIVGTFSRPPLPTDPPMTTPGPAAYVFPVRPSTGASYARSHHDYPATDIFAPCGRPVVANTAGVIDEVGRVDTWRKPPDAPATRGGLFVSLVGDDGVRYYGSHLADVTAGIERGVRVSLGQQLGTVGDTGNARGTRCHLHFGISPPRGPGDWEVRRGVLYPWPYLDSWRAGGTKSPRAAVDDWSRSHLR